MLLRFLWPDESFPVYFEYELSPSIMNFPLLFQIKTGLFLAGCRGTMMVTKEQYMQQVLPRAERKWQYNNRLEG